jgi:hypothetical protein
MYTCWCVWTAASHIRLLVYMNSCFTCTSLGLYEQLVHTHTHLLVLLHMYICWCMWTVALHVHLLLPLGTITVSPHTLCHHKLCGLQNILYYYKLYMDLAVSPHIKYLHKGFVWTIICITTHPLSSQTLVWTIQYHHKSSIMTYQVSSRSLCMDHPVSPQHTAPVTRHNVCSKCIHSLPAFKLLNLRTVKCHCPVAITVAMMTVTTYGKWNCRHVLHCRSCFYLKCCNE